MLGFVNCKLYHSLSLAYPPKFSLPQSSAAEKEQRYCLNIESSEERLAALTVNLESDDGTAISGKDNLLADDSAGTKDILPQFLLGTDEPGDVERLQEQIKEIESLTGLFAGLKFFICREVPREPMTFVIRCFGGTVSWESADSIGATFGIDDTSVTHQIVDRPVVERKHLSRTYIQPQWIFDCVNARKLVSVEAYLPGAKLPPHLSPFAEQRSIVPELTQSEEQATPSKDSAAPPILNKPRKRKIDEQSGQESTVAAAPSVRVSEGKPDNFSKMVASGETARREAIAERKLREMMMPKKNKRLYGKIMYKRKMEAKEERALERKRGAIEANSGGGKGE